jgi:predicted ATPase
MPGWVVQENNHLRLDLAPLSDKDSQRLIGDLLRKVHDLPASLVQLVANIAAGNPYFIEELIEVLIEDGVILRDEPRWSVEMGQLTNVRVPLTLTGVLQARLDSLKPETRRVLQLASVVGRIFWDSAVQYLQEAGGATGSKPPLGSATDTAVTFRALDDLARGDMVARRDLSSFSGAREYVFKNSVLQDVAYESVLRRERRAYHALTAEWLIQNSAGRAADNTPLIADHLEQAGLNAQAAAYLRQAGQQAANRFANQEALAYLGRAISLAPPADHLGQFAARLAREKVLDLLGNRALQRQDLEELERLAEILDDDDKRAQVSLRRANYAFSTSDYPAALAAARPAVALGQSLQNVVYQAEACYTLGRTHNRLGDHLLGRQWMEKSLELARRSAELPGKPARLRALEANGLRMLGNFAAELGDYSTALPYFEQALQLHRAIGDRRGEGSALNNLAILANNMSDFSLACSYHEQVLLIRRETGDRSGEAISYNNLGLAYLSQAEYSKALACLERALALYRQVGDRDGEDGALLNLGLFYTNLGGYDRAQEYLAQALQLAREIGDRQGECLTLAEIGLLDHHRGDQKAAQARCQEALRLALEIDDQRAQSYAWTHLGHVAAAQGAWQDAQIAYQRALEVRRALGLERMAMEPLAGLAQCHLQQGNLVQAQTHVEEILDYLNLEDIPGQELSLAGALDGALEPFRVHLAIFQTLNALRDRRAAYFLQAAYDLLQEQARRIEPPELRRAYLEGVSYHRAMITHYHDFERRSK